jgi:hypothetical protein
VQRQCGHELWGPEGLSGASLAFKHDLPMKASGCGRSALDAASIEPEKHRLSRAIAPSEAKCGEIRNLSTKETL